MTDHLALVDALFSKETINKKGFYGAIHEEITRLRAEVKRLSGIKQQEPVAWMYENRAGKWLDWIPHDKDHSKPLYLHPAPIPDGQEKL